MTLKQQIKDMLNKNDMTMTALLKIMDERYPRDTGRSRTIQNINSKIARESLSYQELSYIVEILGYDINFNKREK